MGKVYEKTKKMQCIGLPKSMVSAKLPFMTRLPKNRGITQAEADKSLTAHTARIATYFVN